MTISYKSIFISDLHLGTRQVNVSALKDFLANCQSDNLFLVGDILDLWEFKQKRLFWGQASTNIIRNILGKAKHGTQVIYIPGNHDEDFRLLEEISLGNLHLVHEYEYTAIDGRKILIIHGDLFDAYMEMLKKHPSIDWLVGWIYRFILSMNIFLRPFFNRTSFSQKIVGFLREKKLLHNDHKTKVLDYAKRRGFDAVICGHTHHPELTDNYINCGDWVDHFTAVVEHLDGRWELLKIK